MILLAIVPLAGLAILAFAGVAAFVLLTPSANPPPVGTRVLVGSVGELAVEVVQQTTETVAWFVRRADGTKVGSGAGRYDQAPIADMLDVAFGDAGPLAAVTLTFLADARTDLRAKAHGDVTIEVHSKARKEWAWSVADDAHDIFALGESPSRGAALLAAEQASSGHLGLVAEGLGDGGDGYPMPDPPAFAHGVEVVGCLVRLADPNDRTEWYAFARPAIVGAFDSASGIPSPDTILDATIGAVIVASGAEGCDVEDLRLGGKPWAEVEPKVQQVLTALTDPTFLSIPGPDELMAAALVGASPDNRGTKERAGDWAIVARPNDAGAGATAVSWWAWKGARLLDSDADFHGAAATTAEAVALAKTAIASLPADAHAEAKE